MDDKRVTWELNLVIRVIHSATDERGGSIHLSRPLLTLFLADFANVNLHSGQVCFGLLTNLPECATKISFGLVAER